MSSAADALQIQMSLTGLQQVSDGLAETQRQMKEIGDSAKSIGTQLNTAARSLQALATSSLIAGKSGLAEFANECQAAVLAASSLKDVVTDLSGLSLRGGLLGLGALAGLATVVTGLRAYNAVQEEGKSKESLQEANNRFATAIGGALKKGIEQNVLGNGEQLAEKFNEAVLNRALIGEQQFAKKILGIAGELRGAGKDLLLSPKDVDTMRAASDFEADWKKFMAEREAFDNKDADIQTVLIGRIQEQIKLNKEKQDKTLDALYSGAITQQQWDETYKADLREKLGLEQQLAAVKADALRGQLFLMDQELKLRQRVYNLDRARIQSNFGMPDTAKRDALLGSFDRELTQLWEDRRSLEKQRKGLGPEEKESRSMLDAQISQIGSQEALVGTQAESVKGTPDPRSWGNQFAAMRAQIQNEWGGLAMQMAGTFKSVFDSAISSISQGITGLIMKTMTWGQALQQIGTTILTSIVNAIVQMGVRWILTQLAMFLFGKGLQASAVASAAPSAASSAAMWAPAATAASAATFGAAATTGSAILLGAAGANAGILAAMSTAGSAGSFMVGGYTGNGSPRDVAGIVHGGEFVFNAPAVNRLGVGTLEAMQRGDVSPGGAAIHNDNRTTFVIYDDKARVTEALKSAEGRAVMVDIMRQEIRDMTR